MPKIIVKVFLLVVGLTFAGLANAATVNRKKSAVKRAKWDEGVSEGMSGALVGGLPSDDVHDDDEDDIDKALHGLEELDGATSFHRTATHAHSKKSARDDDDDDDDDDDEGTLAQAKTQKMQAEAELRSFQDDATFNANLAADVAKVGNETQSPALAEFLGEIKTNQRKYAMPNYQKFLKKEIKHANKKIKKIGAESDDGDKKDDDDDDDDDDEKDKKEKKKKDDDSYKSTIKGAVLPSHQSEGETFAIAFFSNVAMIACVFAMANSANETVCNYTWFLIDQIVCIFLAVMHFQAFDSMLDFSSMGVGNAVFASVVHTLFLLLLVIGVAYYFTKRNNKTAVAVLCGAGAHFVSFSSIHASSSMQNKVFVASSYTVTMCCLGLLVLGVGITLIAYLIYTAKKKFTHLSEEDEPEYMDKSDDVENDAGATAFSVVFTMLVRFILTGHHPDDDETEFDHTAGQRAMMLVYAFVCLVVAGIGINVISRFSPEKTENGKQYAVKRVCNFFKTVLAMNTAWAFLYWGEWEFFEALYPNDPTKGRVMFAVVSTMLGAIIMLILTRIPEGSGARKKEVQRAKILALTALGLVIAFSWELTFDSAVEQMVEGTSHPVYLKVLACLVMLIIIVPVYALYMKPIVDSHSIED